MTIKISNHADIALARLPDQFYGATNLRNILSLYAGRYQELETVFNALLDERAISTANGAQLDRIAEILDLSRPLGETDSAFRSRLFAQTSILQQSGEIEVLISVFKGLTGATTVFSADVYPAAVQLVAHVAVDINDPTTDSQIRLAMTSVKAGGIDLILQFAPVADTFYFSSAVDADVNGVGPIDALHGFSNVSQVTGGKLSRSF